MRQIGTARSRSWTSCLIPENIATGSNRARLGMGRSGVGEFLDPELARLQESNRPASAGPSVLVEVGDEAAQVVYDLNGTNVKKQTDQGRVHGAASMTGGADATDTA